MGAHPERSRGQPAKRPYFMQNCLCVCIYVCMHVCVYLCCAAKTASATRHTQVPPAGRRVRKKERKKKQPIGRRVCQETQGSSSPKDKVLQREFQYGSWQRSTPLTSAPGQLYYLPLCPISQASRKQEKSSFSCGPCRSAPTCLCQGHNYH